MGSLKTPRALVMARPRCARPPGSARAPRRPSPSGPSAAPGSAPAAGRRWRPAAGRAAAPRHRRAHRREALQRDGDEARAGRRVADALQVRRAVARREDGRERDGGGHARRAGPGHQAPSPASVAVSAAAPRIDPARPRPPDRPSPPRWAGSPGRPRAGRWPRRHRRASTPLTNRSPRRYCSSLRSSPVSRATMRSMPLRWLPARLEARPDAADVGQHLLADLVHDPVAEALQEAHHELRLLHQAALLGAHEAQRGPFAGAVRQRRTSPRRPPVWSARASSRNSASWRSRRSRRYGRSHGCASSSNAWVASWSAIQVRKWSSGHAQRAARWPGCSPRRTAAARAPPRRTAARCRTGRARGCPGSRAGSRSGGWSRNRLALTAIAAPRPWRVARSAPGGPRGGRRAPGTCPCWRAPSRPDRRPSWRSTTPGSAAAQARLEQRHDARHGARVGRPPCAASCCGGQRARRARAGDGRRCARPAAQSTRRRSWSGRRGRRRSAPRARRRPRRPTATARLVRRRPASSRRRSSRGHRAGRLGRTCDGSTDGNSSPNSRSAVRRKAATSPVVSWTCVASSHPGPGRAPPAGWPARTRSRTRSR